MDEGYGVSSILVGLDESNGRVAIIARYRIRELLQFGYQLQTML